MHIAILFCLGLVLACNESEYLLINFIGVVVIGISAYMLNRKEN